MMRRMHEKWICGCLAFLNAVSGAQEASRVAIVRKGALATRDQERAFLLLESRLRRWLGNLPFSVEIEREVIGIDAESERLTRKSERLATLSRQVLVASFRGNADFRAVEELRDLRKALEVHPHLGPTLQSAFVADAASEWVKENRDEADRLMRRASSLHPSGAVEGLVELDEPENSATTLAGFNARVAVVEAAGRGRSCSFEIDLKPATAALSINGFVIASQTSLRIVAGQEYTLFGEAPGFALKERKISCPTGETKPLRFHLDSDRDGSAVRSHLSSALRARRGVDSFLAVEIERDVFGVRWCPEADNPSACEPAQSVSVEAILRNPNRFELPLAVERSVPLPISGADAPLNSSSAFLGQAGQVIETRPPDWYNTATFWLVVGGVIAGTSLVYFVSRDQARNGESTESTYKIPVNWE